VSQAGVEAKSDRCGESEKVAKPMWSKTGGKLRVGRNQPVVKGEWSQRLSYKKKEGGNIEDSKASKAKRLNKHSPRGDVKQEKFGEIY